MMNGTKRKHPELYGPLSRFFENWTADVKFWVIIGMIFMLIALNNLLRYTFMFKYYS